jgi:large repetitive protein
VTTITGPFTADQIAIAPDQAPVAKLKVTPAAHGDPTTFDASHSTVAYGAIASYAWDFGDGVAQTTTTPTVTHDYTAPGRYTARVTLTDTAGTSTAVVFTGKSVLRNGGPSATTTTTVRVT